MKWKEMLFVMITSCVSFSVYAADQVIKEELTPSGPEGAIMINQIPPVYSPQAAPQQPLSTPQQQSETRQAVMPSISTTPSPAQITPATPVQPGATQLAPAKQPPETMQGTMPQNTLPNQPQAPGMQQPSNMQQSNVPGQLPLSTPQQNVQQQQSQQQVQ